MAHVKPTIDVSISADCETLTVTDTTPFTDDDDTTTADAGYPRSADTTITLVITYKATTGDNIRSSGIINAGSSTILDIKPTKDGWYLLEVTIVNSYTDTPVTLAGTVEPTNGSTTLNGDSTSFDTEDLVGKPIEIGGEIYYVASVSSAILLILEEKYAGTTTTGLTAVKYPVFSFSTHDDAIVWCNAIKCRDAKALGVVKDNLCGCEPDGEVGKAQTVDSGVTSIIKKKKDNDPSGAQKIAEQLDELCKDCND